MSLFHRRNKVSAHSIQTRHAGPPQVSAAAASAAKLAALNNQKSNPSLSAAAAAAALKQNPHPPTDVANTQTRRLERRGSGSSAGNGSPRPGLERRTSLTERQLRSPSPGRPASSGRDSAVRQRQNAPPVPALPPGVERTPSGRHRAASLEAPYTRISSPPPSQPGGRGMSLDRAPRSPAVQKQTSKAPPKLTKLNEVETAPQRQKPNPVDTTPQRTSVNFSRPMSPPPQSPSSPTSPSSPQTGWFAGAVTSGAQPRQELESLKPKEPIINSAGLSGINSNLQGVADQPVKKKKKRKIKSAKGNEGSHISAGGMVMTGTAVEEARRAITTPPPRSSASPVPPSPTLSTSRASFDSEAATLVEQPEQKSRASAALNRQPSLIDEAPELEQAPVSANTGRKVEALPAAKSQLDAARVAASSPEPAQQPLERVSTVPLQKSEPNGATVQRTQSLSPQRAASTRFSVTPEYLGGIQHQPLGRSASPAKSALKHSPSSSVRTASPDVRFSAPSSEVGMSESIGSLSKKKSNRVSFDERPVIVSGLQESKYADVSPTRGAADFDDDLEDIMKPRPALPSFGSVRTRKDDSPVRHAPVSHTGAGGHSSDHGLGGILAQDFASKGVAVQQPAHDPTLPLPPDVTSVEGTGYASDSESEYSEHPSYNPTPQTHTPQIEKTNALEKEPETIAEAVTSFQAHEPAALIQEQNGAAKDAIFESVVKQEPTPENLSPAFVPPPVIAVQPATPGTVNDEEKQLRMPGGWDDDIEAQPRAPSPVKGKTPTTVEQTQAVPSETSRLTHGIPAALRMDDESETESDTSSIWSDAEEDLPSGPGGFASLNAIVDSRRPVDEVPDLALPGLGLSRHAPPAQDPNAPPSPKAAQWDEATAYWRGLSEKRKKELEQQALKKEQGVAAQEEETSSGEEVTDSEEETDDDMEKTLVEPLQRPSTPPQKVVKQEPKLASPIAFPTDSPPVPKRTKQEPKLRSSMRASTISSDGDDEAPRMKTSLRSSMRQSQESTRSARSNATGEHHFRSSMRGVQPPRPDPVRRHSSGLDDSKWNQPAPAKAAPALTNGRPSTAGSAGPPPKSALKKTAPRPATAVTAPVPAPTLRRQDSDDSVSSFRRQRLSSPGRDSGIVTMRRSMRGGPSSQAEPQRPQSPPEKKKGSLFRLRSLSPAPKEEASPKTNMRSSMRGSASDVGAPTAARTQYQEQPKQAKPSRFKSPTRLGFGRSKPKSPEQPRVEAGRPPPKASSAPKSRFTADSDDEDVPPAYFVSRFQDSDDDEPTSPQPLTKTLTPVRGIPKSATKDDGDSTDLEDSDNEAHGRASKLPPVPSQRDIDSAHGKTLRSESQKLTNGNKPASILSAGSLRKAPAPESAGLGASKFAATPSSPSAAPAERPQQKRRLSWLGLGSSKGKRSSSMPPPVTSPPPSRGPDAPVKPNLLRRSTPTGLPQISEDGNWPLPSPNVEVSRPSTSDGAGTKLKAGTMRPDVGKRRSTADDVVLGNQPTTITTVEGGVGVGDEGSVAGSGVGGRKRVGFNFESGEPVYSERTGKKKKFGGLRKMFGLHD